ncbi:uncharacterized protein Z520_08710 [Fonsecaea multimorphosa CBS 102226]|uniref:Heterokaryon incompatibility domain-containing protein n=1 Tax=Fonsecaea multimorphosa CBS 102226 TaxID=1442371 RepID=A0A0D2H175_9EURO|nr:uncharacterized protein Z520_08710 [Fonsecaea multimorphosa CBS 102226]KIX95590.1 hypothetical protein Z520_08710 [Fonsecaea multimorphosa CBS 102226]OAL21196.1 hypothetical protein AYO22_08159 [Fonsecaea multimorphosa]
MDETSMSQPSSHPSSALVVDFECRSVPLEIRKQLYRPLRPWQTRILRIHPSEDLDSPATCELLTADLVAIPGIGLSDEGERVQYDALSYSWGYPAFTQSVTCNGIRFPVSQTLYDAFRYLRRPHDVRYLWTDAFCIDQANPDEKAKQVAMMVLIFFKARRVVAWLGTCTDDDDFLFSFLSTEFEESGRKRGQATEESALRYSRAQRAATKLITTKAFFQRSWTRVEYHAAQDMELVCGCYTASFRQFKGALGILLPPYSTTENADESRALLRYTFFNRECLIANDMDWFQTMIRSTIYQTTLPQDKVFSTLGIVSKEQHTSLQNPRPNATNGFPAIDYTKPVSLVFQDFLKHTINQEGTLKCLCILQDRSIHSADLPSWAIDLRVDTPRYQMDFSQIYLGFWSNAATQDFDEHGILVCHGTRIASIVSTNTECSSRVPWSKIGGYPILVDVLTGNYVSNENKILIPLLSDPQTDIPNMDRIEKDCRYTWRQVVPEGGTTFSPSDCAPEYAFVSSLAKDKDILVSLVGSDCLIVLRETPEGRFTFLGPAISVQQLSKGGDMYHVVLPNIWSKGIEFREEFLLV